MRTDSLPINKGTSVDMHTEVDGQLLSDMFLTMAYNIREFPNGGSRNRELVDRLDTVMPPNANGGCRIRDWQLRVKVCSAVTGSLIMRHGAKAYIEEIEDNIPTVSGIVTSINCDPPGFTVDPHDGDPDKDREVAVIPVDPMSLQKNVSIKVVSIG